MPQIKLPADTSLPGELEQLPKDMFFNEIVGNLDVFSVYRLSRTCTFFNNIKILPSDYVNVKEYFFRIFRMLRLNRQQSISNNWLDQMVEHMCHPQIYYLNVEEWEEVYSARRLVTGSGRVFFFARSGNCYMFHKDYRFPEPHPLKLTEEERRDMETYSKSLGFPADRKKIYPIIKRIFNVDLNESSATDAIYKRAGSFVLRCAAIFLLFLLHEDNECKKSDWYPYSNWEIETENFLATNNELPTDRFIDFIAKRIMKGELPFSTDLINVRLFCHFDEKEGCFLINRKWNKEIKIKEEDFKNLFKFFQKLLDVLKVTSVEKFLADKQETQAYRR